MSPLSPEAVFQDLWGFRTNPLAPSIDLDGRELDPNMFRRDLNPRRTRGGHLHYYFDLYDWNGATLIGNLEAGTGLGRFPDRAYDAIEAAGIIVFVVGSGKTGRTSLLNLILHRLERCADFEPITVKVDLDSSDLGHQIRSLAQRFKDHYCLVERLPDPSYEVLTNLLDQYLPLGSPWGSGTGRNLFRTYRTLVRQSCERPIVLQLEGHDDYNTWIGVYEAASLLADFVLVEAKDHAYAKLAHRLLLKEEAPSELVLAKNLETEDTERFLLRRLESLRAGGRGAGGEELFPFTKKAIKALFQVGREAPGDTVVGFPIGWLQRRLSRVLDTKATQVLDQVGDDRQALRSLDPLDFTVDEELVFRVIGGMHQN